ncbi:FecR family protein [Aquimarina aquimarini]|uniref:FecR family protein n=1 Tax=Aquimarina aquimarini TaxID=1191734 RepID=UPI000D554A73|nr:FecR domain-containing protein [Aquimarina aquimarini]
MDNYLTIIKRYLQGDVSASERELLQEWLNEDEGNKILFKKEVKEWYASANEQSVDSELAYINFINKIDKNKTKKLILGRFQKVMKYAAILVCVLLGGYYYATVNTSILKKSPNVAESEFLVDDTKIKIIQADGSVIYMDFDGKKEVVSTDGNLLGTKKQNQFVVQPDKNKEALLEYVEVVIPKGKLFQLVLSDSTKVWLNAGSSLRFPQNFVASEENRVVYLEGEAFFDVTKNKRKPFIVKTKEVDVQVLGTRFNVSSYVEDKEVKTTLVEGGVLVKDQKNTISGVQLEPNDQAVFNKNVKILSKKKVNTSLYTSWMDKKILLQNESFSDVLTRIERAYDVTIICHNDRLNNTRFTGEFDVENIEEILKIFSETLKFTYEINKNTIVIHQE